MFPLLTGLSSPSPPLYFLSPRYLLSRFLKVSGKVKVVCFDKTGTLTEDGLTLAGVHNVQHGDFAEETTTRLEDVQVKLTGEVNITHALASCHSLALLRSCKCDRRCNRQSGELK